MKKLIKTDFTEEELNWNSEEYKNINFCQKLEKMPLIFQLKNISAIFFFLTLTLSIIFTVSSLVENDENAQFLSSFFIPVCVATFIPFLIFLLIEKKSIKKVFLGIDVENEMGYFYGCIFYRTMVIGLDSLTVSSDVFKIFYGLSLLSQYFKVQRDFVGEYSVYLVERLGIVADPTQILLVKRGVLKGKVSSLFPSFLKKMGYFIFLKDGQSIFINAAEFRKIKEKEKTSLLGTILYILFLIILLPIIIVIALSALAISIVLFPLYLYLIVFYIVKRDALNSWVAFLERTAEEYNTSNDFIKKAISDQHLLIFYDLPNPSSKTLAFNLLVSHPKKEKQYSLKFKFKEKQFKWIFGYAL